MICLICSRLRIGLVSGDVGPPCSVVATIVFRHVLPLSSVSSDPIADGGSGVVGLGHQHNVKTTPGPPRGVMAPLVLLIHPDPPWFTFSVKFEKVWIRADQSGPVGPRGPQPPLVDQERSGPPWTTLRHFLDAVPFLL